MHNVTTRIKTEMTREKAKAIILAIILTLLGIITAYILLSSGIVKFGFL